MSQIWSHPELPLCSSQAIEAQSVTKFMFVSLLVKVTPKGEAKLELLWKKMGQDFFWVRQIPFFVLGWFGKWRWMWDVETRGRKYKSFYACNLFPAVVSYSLLPLPPLSHISGTCLYSNATLNVSSLKANVRVGLKWLTVTNTLAYSRTSSITTLNKFYSTGPNWE